MDTALLKTFVEVTRVHNFSKAAENLCVTPGAVSARIRQLEEHLGISLFVRQHRRVTLTPAGERLLRHALGILNAWDRAHEDVALGGQQRKQLVMAGVAGFWDIFLQDWLNTIHAAMPSLGLRVEASTAKRVATKLERGVIHLGFLPEPPQLQSVALREVLVVPLIMVSGGRGVDVEEALAEGYVLVDWGVTFNSLHSQHFPHRPPAAARINSGRIARDLIQASGGSAYLPRPLVSDALARGRLFPVEGAPEIPLKAYAAFAVDGEHRETIEQLLSYFDRPAAAGRPVTVQGLAGS